MDLNQKYWKNQIDNDSVIIDVRTPEEFKIFRIPDSINIDFNNPVFFMQEIQKLNKNLLLNTLSF